MVGVGGEDAVERAESVAESNDMIPGVGTRREENMGFGWLGFF